MASERPFGHESPSVRSGRVLAVLGTLGLFVVIAIIVLHVVLRHGTMPHHAQVTARPEVIPPAPRLQPHPDADIAAERAQKKHMLTSYAWIGPSHHFARIPIQRAMQLYVQQHGVPHKSGAVPKSDAPGDSR